MKLSRLFACAIVGTLFWTLPASALMMISPPRPPGPTPSGYVYRYISPVYQTVTDRAWIPERFELVADWVQTGPGRWEQVYHQIVTPGHYETTTRQILVAAGHWELIRIDPVPFPPPVVIVPTPRPPVFINPGTVGVEGYRSGPTEDLSKFSPLTEWPK